ncbi:gluconokinase [Isoptericola sediminis]|uniref:Gluconokinase n=1 Tax=Isoptericola sediminis TaxID=2733572 RepID=A0A849K273_9MICO|nr:gluconokinase [Isoptericola sediminis]NNU26841.1 gluconokinase [Isoptericola sediminis]
MDTDVTTPVDRAAPDAVTHVVVMGVAGSGKTTVAALLAERLGVTYAEADQFHPPANIAKMTAGTPLTDDDRAPWLATIRDWLSAEADAGRPGVVTCSALRRAYRDVLRGAHGRVRFVHLDGPPELLAERMGGRTGHFMPATLLPSQLATLEPLGADEDGTTVSVAAEPADIVDTVVDRLHLG